MTAGHAVGELLRGWRERRRLTQLSLSHQADVSARHLSFIETGRSRPTSDMILRLSEELEVPLRERNALLLAAFYPADAATGEFLRTAAAFQALTGGAGQA